MLKKILIVLIISLFCFYFFNAKIKQRNTLSNSKTYDKNIENIFLPYINNVTEKVEKNWTPPEKDANCQITASISLYKTGKLLKSKIIESTCDNDFDESLLKAIEKAEPYAYFPVGYPDNSANIKITVKYNHQ